MAMAAADGEAAALRAEVAELRLRLQELEKENQRLAKIASSCTCGSKCHGNVEGNVLPDDPSKGTNRKGQQKGDVSHCSKRLIALKVMYFGQRFYGFSSEGQAEPTVEILSQKGYFLWYFEGTIGFSRSSFLLYFQSEIFKALERAKLLVASRKDSCYSRCGRTDKGVSATGQVISLYLRSNIKDVGGDLLDERSEVDYAKVLNRILPRDIRVLGWCPVPADFHARFTCLEREYKYLFWKGDLDIVEMQKAASKFIGEHDFRNFCKMDASNVSNYRRRITEFNISACDKRSNNDELWSMIIKGSAFLWHQVRCMVSVLFLIGQGLESPSIVDSLLDITRTPRKPQYKMAPELPLILRSCLFDKANFMCSSDAYQSLVEHLKDEYHHYMLQATIFHEALSCLPFPEPSSLETCKKKMSHIPLMSRQTEPSYEERIAKDKARSAKNFE